MSAELPTTTIDRKATADLMERLAAQGSIKGRKRPPFRKRLWNLLRGKGGRR